MSQNYDNWERLVRATLLREEFRRICREDSLSSLSSSSSSFSSNSSISFRQPDSPPPSDGSILAFSHRQITLATGYFTEQNLFARGSSGSLFLGQLSEPVVIKRVPFQNLEAYSSEINFFASLDSHSHPRFVPLLGHCSEKEREKFLIYRYLPQRDLANSFFIKRGGDVDGLQSLDWITRWKIARGIAEGLTYLHHERNPPLVHGNIRASSILLDDKFEVRLGSLSRISVERVPRHSRFTWSTKKASSVEKETCTYDVYCLGKVLLELVTGKLGISSTDESKLKDALEPILLNISIHDKEPIINIVDPSLIIDEDLLNEVWAVAIVAKACLNPEPHRRPVVGDVLRALEHPFRVIMDETF